MTKRELETEIQLLKGRILLLESQVAALQSRTLPLQPLAPNPLYKPNESCICGKTYPHICVIC